MPEFFRLPSGAGDWILLVVSILLALAWFTARDILLTKYLVKFGGNDIWWNPLRPIPPPGQYAIIKKNTSEGDFDHILHNVLGHHLVNNTFVRDEEDPSFKPEPKDFLGRNGMAWVGFNKAYYIQPIEYTAWEKLAGKTEYGPVPKKRNQDQTSPYYFFQYTNFLIHVDKAEIKGNFPVNLDILITMRHRNPYKVHFLAGKWTVRGAALVERVGREFVAPMEYEKVRTITEEKEDKFFQKIREAVDTGDVSKPSVEKETFEQKYGLEFDDPEMISIEAVMDPEVKKASQAKAVAEMNRDAADARADEAKKLAQGEADRILTKYQAINSVPNGPFIAFTEAIPNLRTLVLGQGVSIPLPEDEPPKDKK